MVAGSAVLVEGTLLGDILNAGTVYVAETGRVRGMIQAEEVVVAGEIHGDVHARARCEVHPTGLIVGSVRSNACLFREGARVAGVFRVGQVEALLPAASAPTTGCPRRGRRQQSARRPARTGLPSHRERAVDGAAVT